MCGVVRKSKWHVNIGDDDSAQGDLTKPLEKPMTLLWVEAEHGSRKFQHVDFAGTVLRKGAYIAAA